MSGPRLHGKTAIVTGATGVIGAAIARLFADEGAQVMATGRNERRGAALVQEIVQSGGIASFSPAEASDESATSKVFRATDELFGSLDILVNCAGPTDLLVPGGRPPPFTETGLDLWHDVLRVALDGLYLMTRQAVEAMVDTGGGAIVSISSTAAVEGEPGLTAYSTAKGGVNAFTRAVAVEYGRLGIRANAIIPGVVPTSPGTVAYWERPEVRNIILTRPGKPLDIAYAALFLASDEASFITGAELHVDGGLTVESRYTIPSYKPPGAPSN